MLINLTNHPHETWSAKQLSASKSYGEIIDIPFPQVDPFAGTSEIAELADQMLTQLLQRHPDAVLCQGEMTLAFALVARLKAAGIPVLAACDERKTKETQDEFGNTVKTSVFVFRQYREYESMKREDIL